jgi:hypothetical protein
VQASSGGTADALVSGTPVDGFLPRIRKGELTWFAPRTADPARDAGGVS